jgi:hypothetical protein
MPSIKINKLAARLYARTADGKPVSLTRKELEVMFGLIQSEIENYERRIEHALQAGSSQQAKPEVEEIPVSISGGSTPGIWYSSAVEKKEG